jgi:hypothetical protein
VIVMASTLSWLLCLGSVTVLMLLHKKWKKWKKWWIVATVTTLFACSFAGTQLGSWVAGMLQRLLSALTFWTGVPSALYAGLAVLILIPLVYYGFRHDKKANKAEMAGLILLPLLFIIASGPVASHGGTLTDAITNFGNQGLTYLVRG